MGRLIRNRQYYKFCSYGFLKNLRFFDAFFILFLLEKGLPYTQIGILYAVREIAINISEIPSGIIADTFGRKRALIGSFLLYISSFLIFFFSSGFWIFLMAFIFYGMADAFRSGTHKGMIMEYLKLNHWEDQKINYYGHTRAWSQMGSAISYLLTARASQLSSKVAVRNKRSISFITLIFGFIFGVVSGVLYIYGYWIISLLAFVGIFIVENMRKPILTGFIADEVPNEILTSVISAQSFISTIMTALLALLLGIVADHFGLGVSLLTVSLLLALLTIMIKVNSRMHNKRRLAA
jgi:MFS family permease